MFSDTTSRWVYTVEAALIGLPTFGVAMPLLLLLLLASTTGEALLGGDFKGFLFLLWSLTGLFGLVAWFVLTGHYLMGGRVALRETYHGWWAALMSGIASAAIVLAMVIKGGTHYFQWLDLFTGPLLILPATHLIYLRFGR